MVLLKRISDDFEIKFPQGYQTSHHCFLLLLSPTLCCGYPLSMILPSLYSLIEEYIFTPTFIIGNNIYYYYSIINIDILPIFGAANAHPVTKKPRMVPP